MRASDVQKLKDQIAILPFLNSLGAQALKREDGKYIGECPFHEGEDPFLEVRPETKDYACSWCEASGDIFDYAKGVLNYDQKEAYKYIKDYWEKNKPSAKCNIKAITKHEIKLNIDDRYYQLTGVNLRKLNYFSMTLKIEHQGKFCLAEVNLSRPKSKNDFIEEVKNVLFLSEEIIQSDMKAIMEMVGELQEENIKKQEEELTSSKAPFILSSSDEKKAKDDLATKDIFNECLLKDTERMGYVGDDLGKKVLYLAATSRLLIDPVSILSMGLSSGGKSYAQENIVSLIPSDEFYAYTRLTPNSFSHYGKHSLQHRLVCVDEFKGIEEGAMYQVRSMLSKGMLSIGFTSIDRVTGKMETLSRDIFGPIAFMTSCTSDTYIDDETMNRFVQLPVDESAEQTLKVIESMIFAKTKKGLLLSKEREKVRHKYRAIQAILKPLHVLIPDNFVKEIKLKRRRLTVKRQFKNYLGLLSSLALHRQYQRKVYMEKDINGEYFNYLYVTRADIDETNEIIDKLYGHYPGELDTISQKMLSDLTDYCTKKAKGKQVTIYDIEFTRKDIRDFAVWEHTPCRRAFEKLGELEYIYKVSGFERSRHYYKLTRSEDDVTASESWIKLR